MSWIDIALGGAAGAVTGWVAHFLYCRFFAGSATADLPPPEVPSATGPASVEPSVAGERTAPAGPTTSRVSGDATVAGRVILHLYGLGRLEPHEVATIGFTQRGMVDTLALRQGTLTKVLARLKAAGVIEVDRRHVTKESRRMNVYRLSALGESVARELRRTGNDHPPP